MMNQTHRLVGGSTAFVVTTAAGMPPEVVLPCVGAAVVGSSLPDDVERLLRLPHRRMTHYPVVQVAICGLFIVAAVVWEPRMAGIVAFLAASTALGCLMHSCADAMTVDSRGIALLWPIRRRGYHLMPWSMRVWVGSRSRSERLFALVWSGFVLIYAYARFGHLILA